MLDCRKISSFVFLIKSVRKYLATSLTILNVEVFEEVQVTNLESTNLSKIK